jgi:hypothetical protein
MIAVRRSHSRIVGSAVAACVDIILIRHVILTHHLGTALYLTGLNGRVMSSTALVSLLSTFLLQIREFSLIIFCSEIPCYCDREC